MDFSLGSATQKSGQRFEFGLSLQTRGIAPQAIASKAVRPNPSNLEGKATILLEL